MILVLLPLWSSYLQPTPVQTMLRKAENELGWAAKANDPQHVYVRCLECINLRL